jgi:energy-coupling factor transporter ATP-binding protein EcfA2
LGVYRIAAGRFGARRLLEHLPTPRVRASLLRRELEQLERRAPAAIRLSRPLCKALQLAKAARDHELAKGEASREALRIVSYAAQARLPSSRRGPFVLVSVSGPDGVGKTTLARALQGFLEQEVGVPATYHWTRLGCSPPLDLIRALASQALDSAGRLRSDPAAGITPRFVDRSVLGERPRALRAWGCVLAADLLARLWARHARSRMAGGIHIFDRHAIDGVADLEAMYAVADARWLARLAPRPDVRILFRDGGPEAIGYAPYEAVADALLTPRDSIDVLVDHAAGEVLKPYVQTRERT